MLSQVCAVVSVLCLVADTYRVFDALHNGMQTMMTAMKVVKKAVSRCIGGEGSVGGDEQGTRSQVE